MDVKIYDEEMNMVGFIDEYTSLLWTRKYYEPGSFDIKLPLTARNIDYIKLGRIIHKDDALEAGIIEYIKMVDISGKKYMDVSGRFLSAYMDIRVLTGTHRYTGTSEAVMRQMLSDVVAIPHVYLGELAGFTDTITKQTTYKNLLKVETDVAQTSGHGYRFRPDFTEKKIYFEVYDGLDKSMNQGDRSRVIFSEGYANLNQMEYTKTDALYRTLAYVGGEGEGSERIFVTIGNTSATGTDRREVFIDARDIQREEGMSLNDYKQLLINRGNEKLKEMYKFTNSIDSTVNPMLNFEYKRDYDLGDIITVEKESWGIYENLRITELMEQYVNGGMVVIPTLGDPLPTLEGMIYDE